VGRADRSPLNLITVFISKNQYMSQIIYPSRAIDAFSRKLSCVYFDYFEGFGLNRIDLTSKEKMTIASQLQIMFQVRKIFCCSSMLYSIKLRHKAYCYWNKEHEVVYENMLISVHDYHSFFDSNICSLKLFPPIMSF